MEVHIYARKCQSDALRRSGHTLTFTTITQGVTWRNAGSGDISFIKTIAPIDMHSVKKHAVHAVCLMLHNENDEEEVTV